MFIVDARTGAEMFEGFFGMSLAAKDTAQVIAGIRLIRVNLDSGAESLRCEFRLTPLEINEPELAMGIGVARIQCGDIEMPFQSLPRSQTRTDPHRFAL